MTRNLLLLSMGQDTAGVGIRTKQAFDRHAPDWRARSMHVSDTYLRYPVDLYYREPLARELYDRADVVHHHNTLFGYHQLDNRQGKPAVLEHHGTGFREGHAQLANEARKVGAVQVASTIDLAMLEPDVSWLPVPYNLDEIAAVPPARFPQNGRIRIGHAPTNREIKSTDLIIAVVRRLAKRYPVDLVLVERKPWRMCLMLKRTVDIFVDQLILGYGCNALECWAMGMPVVAGTADPKVAARMRELVGELPFYAATEKNLERRLEALVNSADLRAEWAERGRRYVERFHAEEKVVERMRQLYATAPATRGAARRPELATRPHARHGLAGFRPAHAAQ